MKTEMKTKILVLISVLALVFGLGAFNPHVTIISVKQVGVSIVINGTLDCNKYNKEVGMRIVENSIHFSIYAVDPSPYVECGNKKPFTINIVLPLQKGQAYKVYVNGKYWLTFKK